MYCVTIAKSKSDIERCFPVMSQLRPHIKAEDFVQLVRDQMENGYSLAYLADGQNVFAVAGFRELTNLAWGKFLYVDDLVTDEKSRSKGLGKMLLQWLNEEAARRGCAELHLDSGTQRIEAHRFYKREGMNLTGYHFMQKL